MKKDFYKTTLLTTGADLSKVGVYKGTAPFIGTPANTIVLPSDSNYYTPTYPAGMPTNSLAKLEAGDAGRLDTPNEESVNPPVAAVCGNGILEGEEVCDSTLTSECWEISGYYKG